MSDGTSLAERVLSVIVQRLDWQNGIFFRQPDPGSLSLIAVTSLGPALSPAVETGRNFEPPEEGMIALAIRTGRVCYSVSLMEDARVTPEFRAHSEIRNNPCLVVVPAVHDGAVHGVIVLRDSRRRELPEAEIRTLESLGQVIGMSSAHARNLRELAHRANHDALTGLGNRSALHDYLAASSIKHYSVMLFDLDHFKQVNDALGHTVGDSLLCAVAERMRTFLANSPAALFRLGGDEFVVIHTLAADADGEAALGLAGKMANTIAQPVQVGELSLRLSASIGVALAPAHSTNSHELLRCADVAMYHAKHSGIGFALYERDIDAYKLEDLTLLSAVNNGLDQHQFTLFYQPIVNVETGAIRGCEALIRWNHPIRGLVEAHEFMPLIENTDLIRSVTHRVIDIAMADAARWRERGIDYRLALNLSARNILDSELPDHLLKAAARNEIDPRCVQLEITETILIRDPNSAGKVLHELADAGFTLALDDFGTGFSSMAYLARFPIHMLKIDRSFVHAMLDHAQSRAIVETTIALARGLGLKVTGEGVEYEDEVRLLDELGCDFAQGFLFGRPVPEEELAELWLHQTRNPDYGVITKEWQ